MEFILREGRPEDAESVALYANNYKIARNLRDSFPFPYTVDHARWFIESCLKADAGQWSRAIVVGGEAVGSISITAHGDVYRKSAELGYWLGEPFWGREIMPRAIQELCAQAFLQLRLERIDAEVFGSNLASARALEKAGFQLEGILRNRIFKNGVLQNARLYALLRDEAQPFRQVLTERECING